MKKIKLVKNIKVILGTLFILIVGIIIMIGVFSGNKAMAAVACEECSRSINPVATASGCKIVCDNQSCPLYDKIIMREHVWGTPVYTPQSVGSHQKETQCSRCGYVKTETGINCSGGEHPNGTCDYCGLTYQNHSQGDFWYYETTNSTHQAVYKCTSYSTCGKTYWGTAYNHSWSNGECTTCGYDCTHPDYTRYDWVITETTHTGKYCCSICGVYTHTGSANAHTPTHANDGKCTDCGHKCETHSRSNEIVDYVKTQTGHTPIYGCTLEGCNGTYTGDTEQSHTGGTHAKGKCTVCQYKYQTHEQSTTIKEYKKAQSGHTPVYKCTEATCDFTYDGTEAAHTGATHANDGICTVEGCGYQYQIHKATTTVTEYVNITKTKHTPIYTCAFKGCTSTVKGTAEDHTGGTHENDGICTLCKKQYQTHGQSTEIADYIKHEDLHIELYKCTEPTCTKLLIGLSELHKGGTHENDGKCTVCDYQYQIHGVSDEFARYEITETGHTVLNKCTFTGCEGTHKVGEEEAHKGGTHENDGKCTVCDKQYQIHGVSDEFARYEITETGHTVLNKCTFTGCEGTHKVGEEEAHKGGTHENDGICTVCSHQYQIHGVSDEFARYEITETGHTELYKCTFTGCEGTHKVGEEEPHEGGIHENDGICTVCDHKYQTHEKTTEISKYMIDESVHLVLYKCSHPGCTSTYTGNAEDHKGGTHENGGKCTVCEYQYQAHNPSEEVAEYEITETGHTTKYKCTYEGCEGTHLGEEEAHKGGNHENDGKCTVCDHQYQIHGKSDDIKEYIPTENGHKPIYGCTDPDCTETYEGDEESHSGATHDNGGKCVKCEEIYEEHGKSDEVKEYEPTENGHKPIYECTYPECDGTHKGEEKPHNVEEWTDEENGVHSGECTDCGEEVTEEHSYGEDGKCEDCEAIIPEDECQHTYKIEKNETHHWNFCPKCRTTEEGSLELHKYGGYTVNEEGTHSATCTVCEYKLTEKHNYEEDGKCEDCDERIPEEECKHAYEMRHDETQHWKFCPKCETIEDGTKGNHTYGKYVDNGDGTHGRTCTVCEYKQTEQHNEECDKCKEKESTSGSGDNATNGDNTTADKEIPKAGMQNMVLGLIISIGALAIITKFKMKKYKDI